MANIIVPSRRISSAYIPKQGRLNFTNPLTKNLQHINGRILRGWDINSTPPELYKDVITPKGPASTGTISYFSNWATAYKPTAGTIVTIPYYTTTDYKYGILGYQTMYGVVGYKNNIFIKWNDTWNGRCKFDVFLGTTVVMSASTANTIKGDVLALTGGGDGFKAYVNGALLASDPTIGWVNSFASDTYLTLLFNSHNGGVQGSTTLPVLLHLVYDRQLSENEVKSLSSNPGQLFELNTNRVYFDPPIAQTTTEPAGTQAPYIQIPSRRLTQIQKLTTINDNHPSIYKMQVAWNAAIPYKNLVDNSLPYAVNANSTVISKAGIANKCEYANANMDTGVIFKIPQISGVARSALGGGIWLSSVDLGWRGGWIKAASSIASDRRFMVGPYDYGSGAYQRFYFPWYGCSGSQNLTDSVWDRENIKITAGTYDGVTNKLAYNGRIAATGSLSYTEAYYTPVDYVYVSTCYENLTFCGFYWARNLSDNELINLTANPWQLFKIPTNRAYFDQLVTQSTPTYAAPLAISNGELLQATSIPLNNLGSGTPDETKYLRGDGVWALPVPIADPNSVLELNNLGGL